MADWVFCTKEKPCGKGRGDCDGNEECQLGLVCGPNNCKDFNAQAHPLADCCVPKKGNEILSINRCLQSKMIEYETLHIL